MERESFVMGDMSHKHEEPLNFFLDVGDANERCGICCSPVTSRGVLDCCSHIYCFTCIDIWSAITNICPICKLQFKFITFIPCAENEDSNKVDAPGDFADLFEQERDQGLDDVIEEDGSFCFPSYFIDEDAVVCLDGDGCQVRSAGVAQKDGDSGVNDTSVACDSCDCWYHAICVGYKPENQTSWLCPRCCGTGSLGLKSHFNCQENSSSSEKIFSLDKTSNENIFVASDNVLTAIELEESAVDVTMTGREGIVKDFGTYPSLSQPLELCELEMKTCMPLPNIESLPSPIFLSLEPSEKVCAVSSPVTDLAENLSSPVKDLVENLSILKEDMPSETDHGKEDGEQKLTLLLGSASNITHATSAPPLTGVAVTNSPLDANVKSSSHPDHMSLQVSISGSDESVLSTWDAVNSNVLLHTEQHEKEKIVEVANAAENHEGSKAMVEDKLFSKKQEQSQALHGNYKNNDRHNLDLEKSEVSQTRDLAPSLKFMQDNLTGKTIRNLSLQVHVAQEQQAEELCQPVANRQTETDSWSSDIGDVAMQGAKEEKMDVLSELVQGPKIKAPSNSNAKSADANEGNRETNDCVRTRKIVHRGNNLDRRTSALVEQVQLRLKETVGFGMRDRLGKAHLTNEKLFAELKAAIVDTQVHMKQSLAPFPRAAGLQKGLPNKDAVRQNLTRKLYGSSGKRRQTWDRDWDIAFWKEKASREKKARYHMQTVNQSLELELAQMEKVIHDSKKMPKAESDSILNRIYLADTSLLPRQTDIEPLAVQQISQKNSMPLRLTQNKGSLKTEKASTEKLKNMDKASKSMSGKRDNGKSSPVAAAKSLLQDPVQSSSSVSYSDGQQDLKSDKQKWALQVLARKTGQGAHSSMPNGNKSAQELSLLVRLPAHMRPVVEYERRSKVPTSIRQIHLDRFLEHYLQNAKFRSLNEGTECKSAILAAENKEKDIYNRANSKSVYVNLCVQALHLLSSTENAVSTETEVITPQAAEASQIEGLEATQMEKLDVERALKAAGLISDSPLGSPCQEDSENRLQEDEKSNDLQDIKTGGMPSNKEILPASMESVSDPKVSMIREVFDAMVQDDPSTFSSPNTVPACEELTGTEKKNAEPEVVMSAHDPQVIDETEHLKNGGVPLIGTQEEVFLKCKKFSGDGQKLLVCIDDKHASEGKRLRLLETDGCNNRTMADDMMRGNFDSNAASRIPDESLVFDLPEDKISEGFEEYGSMLAYVAPEEEAALHEALGNKLLKEEPLSDSLSVAEKGTLDQAPNLNAKLEKISKQVERFVKEHIRPLHKSHVITTEQYRWAVAKTTSKVMQHHTQAKSADFLIPEGDKVKRLAEQYLQAFQQHKVHVKK